MSDDTPSCESRDEVEQIEITLLLEGVYRLYGYDFRDYSPASIIRRIRKFLKEEKLPTASILMDKLLRDPAMLRRFLFALSVSVTSFFRDPAFYRRLRELAIPDLRDMPSARVWIAGCSTGEEAYSMAILLEEEGLLPKTRIYATDLNEDLLETARNGVYLLDKTREFISHYKTAGGRLSLPDYYRARHGHFVMRSNLRSSIVWAQHNLVTDASFNEFNVILCRNVLIYFNRTLQDRVHHLIYDSLAPGGVLGLGNKESLSLSALESCYETLDKKEKLYRKIK